MPRDGAQAGGRGGGGDGVAAASATGRLLHASCVQLDGAGVIVRGASGSGKSDLCLRLIDAGGLLVADDQVLVECGDGDLLFASAPSGLAGLIEVRGVGILRLPRVAGRSPVRLVVDLCPRDRVVRLPERGRGDGTCELLGVALPRLGLDPFAASTCAKIGFALRVERVH
jgi:serine kinase of HPr protein (carbohydrate metabolism regulator)